MLTRCYESVSTRICGGLDFPGVHTVDAGAFPSTSTEPPCCQRLACPFASCRCLRFDFVLCHVIPLMAEWKFLAVEFREAELKMNVMYGRIVGSHGMVAPEIVDK
jgi:hypothetical protein